MKDTIYREDAIKAVKRVSENYTGKGKRDYHPHVDFIVDELKYCVPSAERPQGEWIETPDGTMCGNCHKFPYDDGEYHIANWSSDFCPHCGARMKGADSETAND